ncbi:lipoate-protein ligase B [Alicycliphilus sp. B1]|nr:lipoate-protein ligase B [Alicycliphilus sp. B1]
MPTPWPPCSASPRSAPADTADELWICEHPPVYTQGIAGKRDHILVPGDIPVVATNRGGQVTHHGPGQGRRPIRWMDLHRAGYYVKEYVHPHRGRP